MKTKFILPGVMFAALLFASCSKPVEEKKNTPAEKTATGQTQQNPSGVASAASGAYSEDFYDEF